MNALPAPHVLHADGRFHPDRWHLLRETEGHDPAQPTLLPLVAYLHETPSPLLGTWLAPHDSPFVLKGRLDLLPLIAIDFPKFADGRGYSIAALLRTRLNYRGELRATGEVLVDQVFMLRRVGFDSFALRADQAEADARTALRRYSAVYQAAADVAVPAFKRRAAVLGAR